MTCKGCYCNIYMQKREGCLYMFKGDHERLHKECPCKDCIVQLMCSNRYNRCEKFHVFLNDNLVRITPEADKFNTCEKSF